MTDKALPTSSSPVASASSVPAPTMEGTKGDVVVTPASTQTPPPSTPTPKKPIPTQLLFAVVGLLVLVVGAAVGFYLLGSSQEIRQQAAGGYADCAGGVKDGDKACSGFRELVICRNGAFTPAGSCLSDERCQQANGAASCVKTARECAGGVKDGETACSGLRTQVTCKDGTFVDEVTCTGNLVCQSGRCGGGTSTGTPTPRPSASPVGACQPLTASCDNESNPCCAGGVCQGVGANRRCEAVQNTCDDPASTNDGVCGGGQGWLGFRCSQLTSGQCNENAQTFSSYQDAYDYANANGCGQVDEVCVGGWKNRQLCGSFQIISSGCSGTGGPGASPQPSVVPGVTPTPVVSPTPGVTPSPVASPTPGVTPSPAASPAPVCVNITMNTSSVVVGDNVSFTCGTVPGATSYQFRVKAPDGTISSIAPQVASGNVSQSFAITQKGSYKAQCRICVDSDRCQEWETF